MDKIKVSHNIPIPEAYKSTGLTAFYRSLSVGASFEIPIEHRTSYMNTAARLKKQEGLEFVSRRVTETTVRIWRTK